MAHASVIFFWLAFLLYGAAFAVFLYYLFSRRSAMNSVGLALVVAGVACQTAAIVLRGVSAGRVPVVGAYESLNMVAWSIVLVYLVLELFTRIKAVGLYVMPIVLVLLTVALVEYKAPGGLMPALRSDIVVLHVIVMFVAIGCLYVVGARPSSTWSRRRSSSGTGLEGCSAGCRHWRPSRSSSTTRRCSVCRSSPWAWWPASSAPRPSTFRTGGSTRWCCFRSAPGPCTSSCCGAACAPTGSAAASPGWPSPASSCCWSSASPPYRT